MVKHGYIVLKNENSRDTTGIGNIFVYRTEKSESQHHHIFELPHIKHLWHRSAKKFLGRKRVELSHITHQSHLNTSVSEEVLRPAARRTITHHTFTNSRSYETQHCTFHHISQRRSSRSGSEENYHTSHITQHHSAQKFSGQKQGELLHITHHSQSHLTTSLTSHMTSHHITHI